MSISNHQVCCWSSGLKTCTCMWWFLHGSSNPGCPVLLRTQGGEWRPSAMSDSEHWASPCMTAKPRRKRSAYDCALKRTWHGNLQLIIEQTLLHLYTMTKNVYIVQVLTEEVHQKCLNVVILAIYPDVYLSVMTTLSWTTNGPSISNNETQILV